MKSFVHRELAYDVLSAQPYLSLRDFLLEGVAKKNWNKSLRTREEWVKEWMDMPDSNVHSSKLKNDHSYKLAKVGGRFEIKFARSGSDQATVVARLKYAARDIKEWKEEEEYRVCSLELAKSIHWVIDINSPPHAVADWPQDLHSKIEGHFDTLWRSDRTVLMAQVKLERATEIKDIYRWAMAIARENYDRNMRLLQIYQTKGSILKAEAGAARSGDGPALGQKTLLDAAQNLSDYLAWMQKRINIGKSLAGLRLENGPP